ncbi:MAG: A/G-specific adenine glycosylase [Draconibacterium sp.]|nr:MAG: A/G-specific adenine glycosylase [Draconibacterium sp.]
MFTNEIHQWYLFHRRDLPWRKTSDPYHIWLSEIILQQTRVAQGMSYYFNFVKTFPDVYSLACASEDQVLKMWQGLGYYSRARNLHSTAKLIVEKYGGRFPNDYKKLLKLKGVGPYTAAAVASIAFGLPYPVIDGNIYRIISRYYGVKAPVDTKQGKAEIEMVAKELMLTSDPGFHNQALMEFGALQCVPGKPDCAICPVVETCYAAKNGLVEQLPAKQKKVKQRIRYFYYFLIESSDKILMEKRQMNDIWKNLYQLPLFESDTGLDEGALQEVRFPFQENRQLTFKSISGIKKHVLTHQIIYARLLHFQVDKIIDLASHFLIVNKKDISNFAVPRLLEMFLDEYLAREE